MPPRRTSRSPAARPAADEPTLVPLTFRLHRSLPTVKIAVRPGMSRDELQACLVYQYAAMHRIDCVLGVYIESAEEAHAQQRMLVPLAALAAEPACCEPTEECALVVSPPYVPPTRRRWPGGSYQAALAALAALSIVVLVQLGPFTLLCCAVDPVLRHLYRHGPQFGLGGVTVGFWESAALHDVCARITSHDAAFWLKNPDECDAIYARKEDAWVLFAEYVLLALVLWRLLSPAGLARAWRAGRGTSRAALASLDDRARGRAGQKLQHQQAPRR